MDTSKAGVIVQAEIPIDYSAVRMCLDCHRLYPRVERPAYDGLCDECGPRRTARVRRGLPAVPRARRS